MLCLWSHTPGASIPKLKSTPLISKCMGCKSNEEVAAGVSLYTNFLHTAGPIVQTRNAIFTSALLKASLGILLSSNLTSHPKPDVLSNGASLPPPALWVISSGDMCFYFYTYSSLYLHHTPSKDEADTGSPVTSPCAVAGSSAGFRQAMYLQGAG